MRKKSRKKQTPKKKHQPKKQKPTQINFLLKEKDYTDRIYDIVEKNTAKNYYEDQDGNYHFRRSGYKELARKLGVNVAQLKRWEKFGIDEKKLSPKHRKTINSFHKGISKTKKESKQFTKHTFTRENFFHKKKLPKRTKHQQFYFRAGLFLKFNNGYTIQNLPLSHYDFKGYPEGYEAMWSLIKHTIAKFDSLVFFRINYFDVSLIDLVR